MDEPDIAPVPPAAPTSAETPAIAVVRDDTLPPGVSQSDFDAALALGREKGVLSPDDLIDALHEVELTAEVLATLLARINAAGVALIEEEVDDLSDEAVRR